MSHYSKNNSGLAHRPTTEGFTLTELLVSVAIVTVILTVVISSQSTYTDGAALANLADEIGLTISQAQAYGTGVKEFSPGSGEFSASYGLTFSLLGSGSNAAYLSFADRNANQMYDGTWSCPVGGASECLVKANISRGNYIESICVARNTGSDVCNEASRVDISFLRPNTEAQLTFFNTGGSVYSPANMKGAKITLRSPRGGTRFITVYLTGQISVQ